MHLASKVNRITEKEYRSLRDRLSYSSLKLYDSDRERFYKELVMGEKVAKKESPALVLGSLVHSLLSGIEGDFDSKFHIFSAKVPKPQLLKLCENLYTRSLQSMNEYGEQQDSFKVIFSDAVDRTKYNFNREEVEFKGKDEAKILEMFEGSDAEVYYRESVENHMKTMVSIPQIEQAERLVSKIKENPVTEKYVSLHTEWLDETRKIKATEVFNELPIMFEINEVPYKCLPDKLVISHINKTIQPIDWKCSSWDNESPENQYLKYGYYLQAALYDYGIRKWATEHELTGYVILPMIFAFIDTSGFNNPVLLTLSEDDINRANRGFKIRGTRYRGMAQIIENLNWNLETGIWGSSKELYLSGGVLRLQLPYGTR